MSKKSSGKQKNGAGLELNPLEIYFSHSKLRKEFSTGQPVEETLAAIERGDITVDDIPRIQVSSSSRSCCCCRFVLCSCVKPFVD